MFSKQSRFTTLRMKKVLKSGSLSVDHHQRRAMNPVESDDDEGTHEALMMWRGMEGIKKRWSVLPSFPPLFLLFGHLEFLLLFDSCFAEKKY